MTTMPPRGCGTCAKFRAIMPARIRNPLEQFEQRRLAKKAAKAQRKRQQQGSK